MSAPDEAANRAGRTGPAAGSAEPSGRVEDDGPAGTASSAGSTGTAAGSTGTPGGRPSGLRDPDRAVRGLGALTLSVETLVLLLAIQPIRLLGGDLGGSAIGVVVGLAMLAVVLAGCLRRPWAWHAATVLQGLLLLAGFLHWSLGALGLIFAGVWAYVLHVRRAILG
ncbi:DUF4233 domain-containing protein [Plantactinospora sp. KLBMP9567]|uniref:DUF4233 domain-containing protein n=1 Tax=Plantactinospora sp. KLBMP9567 TaxID=3085900 RepID=UPI0029828EF5|nr:DUF4233 domain-containing protein [Plantactinospora sp. KLBMP9567]MDW5327332.1 DUF4233 domain-containing protein [Plantactinospora sp. KLBMP9567]MDW5330694.1 DUF4233 domain-containing protein [Plantactinospora sp. KLBMP9567]